MKAKPETFSEDELSEDDSVVSLSSSAEEVETLQTNKRKTKSDNQKKNKKLKRNGDVNDWNNVENKLDHSKLFTEQVNDLLRDVKLPSASKASLMKWYNKIEKCLLNDLKEYPDVVQSKLKSGKAFYKNLNDSLLPYSTNEDLTLQFLRPVKVSKLGDFALDVSLDGVYNLNVIVRLPKVMLRKRDYLNNIYFIRKHYYLRYLAYELRRVKLCEEIEYSFYNNVRYLPVARLRYPSKTEQLFITLFVTPEEDSFKLSRFIPLTNNLKFVSELLRDTLKNITSKVGGATCEDGSPLYNTAVLHDLTLEINHNFSQERFKDCTDFIAAFNALRIWLNNRKLLNVIGGVSEDVLLYLMCYQFHKIELVKHQNSYQIINQFLHSVSTSDWSKESLYLGEAKLCSMDVYKQNFDFVWLDRSGTYNVAAFLSTEVYSKLREEAGSTLKCLRNGLF